MKAELYIDPETLFKRENSDQSNISNYDSEVTKIVIDEYEKIRIGPNPNNGRFSVYLPKEINDNVNFELLDIYGKKVDYIITSSIYNIVTFDISNNLKGVYIL